MPFYPHPAPHDTRPLSPISSRHKPLFSHAIYAPSSNSLIHQTPSLYIPTMTLCPLSTSLRHKVLPPHFLDKPFSPHARPPLPTPHDSMTLPPHPHDTRPSPQHSTTILYIPPLTTSDTVTSVFLPPHVPLTLYPFPHHPRHDTVPPTSHTTLYPCPPTTRHCKSHLPHDTVPLPTHDTSLYLPPPTRHCTPAHHRSMDTITLPPLPIRRCNPPPPTTRHCTLPSPPTL
ncbi:hypothetical protein Pcinc_030120 [Petrolisthes cinctipes]|uniref:Uncharacterized protein n=1 Tax=Petrolisthes cinctipes TaxID=88211 RepID=A0AAE1K6S6_PETCI|nr:hypothetical protein Pcinc_030120 [Petrolisthes cinctipes]